MLRRALVSVGRTAIRQDGSFFQPSKQVGTYRGYAVSAALRNKEQVTTEGQINEDAEQVEQAQAQTEVKEKAPEERIQELEEENKKLQDRVLRALAEAENVRHIASRDVKNAREFAISSFAKGLLDVADNLTRAIEAVPAEVRESGDSQLKSLLEGVIMTEDQLQKTFTKFGLCKVGQVGEKFDPQLHDAMFEVDDPTKEVGTIAQLMKVGYTLNDRLLRPAQVGTVKARS